MSTPGDKAHDDERQGYKQALKLLKSSKELRGIYVSTVNSLPVQELSGIEYGRSRPRAGCYPAARSLSGVAIGAAILPAAMADWGRTGGAAMPRAELVYRGAILVVLALMVGGTPTHGWRFLAGLVLGVGWWALVRLWLRGEEGDAGKGAPR